MRLLDRFHGACRTCEPGAHVASSRRSRPSQAAVQARFDPGVGRRGATGASSACYALRMRGHGRRRKDGRWNLTLPRIQASLHRTAMVLFGCSVIS
jgi:hypothetical protein